VNELNKVLNEKKIEMSAVRTTPAALVELIGLVESGKLTGASAKEVFAEIVQTGKAPSEVVASRGLEKIADSGAIEGAARAAIAANPKAVADFKSGKEAALKSLIGGVMKQTKGQADPKLAEEALRKLLS
jgi:aspartyl-tRNA(Asn)/glutamyl-tRNA(Gln) amidotransferase subunit B